ncbi:MAG: hypothetical protein H6582_01185 [Crocinitomicaceae bacterium]|nr:hypothetical protein [Crocinitomicaceae bacterium]
MRPIILTILILLSTVAKSNDTLNVKNHQSLVFAQFGGVPSIYIVGYGHEFRKDKNLTWGVLGGFGMDFIRFQPYYNIETELKGRIQYNFDRKNALIFEIGSQYVFNPWYMTDPDKYFPDCKSQRCPDALFNHFFDIGYRHSFQNGLSLIGQLYCNYYDGFFLKAGVAPGVYLPVLPGFEISYSFVGKRRITQ